jgi:putative spermidine/putrescine transport system substrate-binding protein
MSDIPEKPERLVVMTWPLSTLWGQALKHQVSEPFTARTGIPVKHVEYTSVDLPLTLLQALEENRRPPGDVVYGNTIPLIHLSRAGYADPLTEAWFPVLKELNPRARPVAAGLTGWPFVIVYDVRYVMMYRKAAFPAGPPESWQVMLDPPLKGRISLYPGGKGFFPIAQVLGGGPLAAIPEDMEPCWSFLRALRPQVEVLEFNQKMTEHVRNGEIDVHCTVLTNIMQWQDQGFGVAWQVPREGITVGDDGLLVPKGLPDKVRYWAKRYLSFALEREVQRSWCRQLGVCPMQTGIARPPRFAGDLAYPDAPDDYANALFVPNSILEKFEHRAWREKFNEIFNF